jgi:hypothetical protein
LRVAPRNDAGEQFRQSMTLNKGERARIAPFVEAFAPGAPRCRAFDAEKMARAARQSSREFGGCSSVQGNNAGHGK